MTKFTTRLGSKLSIQCFRRSAAERGGDYPIGTQIRKALKNNFKFSFARGSNLEDITGRDFKSCDGRCHGYDDDGNVYYGQMNVSPDGKTRTMQEFKKEGEKTELTYSWNSKDDSSSGLWSKVMRWLKK
ncbi:MAG: hypothetical protein WBQ73_04230 [Candidatus Babeliales bacterium]